MIILAWGIAVVGAESVLAQSRFVRGDADSNGQVELTDGVVILQHLFGGLSSPIECLDAADVNDRNGLDLSDAVYVLSFLYLGGAPPPAPSVRSGGSYTWRSCGQDPTPDELGCARFGSCPQSHARVENTYDALALVEPSYLPWTFSPGPAEIQRDHESDHIQGIGYYRGRYYVVRSRPAAANTQKLLVIDEVTRSIVDTFDLDARSVHPGGIQIHDGILVVPFSSPGENAWLSFYDLSGPSPRLVGSFDTGVGNGYCAGITEYEGHYLVALYYSRSGTIRFYRFNASFQRLAEQRWSAADETTDTSGWYPFSQWRNDTSFNYECMSLVKMQHPRESEPRYFLLMYHETNSVDMFSLSDPSLDTTLEVEMVYSLDLAPFARGFRYAAGAAVTADGNLRFFSTLKHVQPTQRENVISLFEPRPGWPWKLNYRYDTGGDSDVAMSDSGVCLELHNGSPGGANENRIYERVGMRQIDTGRVLWGPSRDTGWTGQGVTVALNARGDCVAMCQGAGANSNRHDYRVGLLDDLAQAVSWTAAVDHQTGGDIAVALNDNGLVVEVHRGRLGGANENRHYYGVGQLDSPSRTIAWLTRGVFYATGGSLSVAMDNRGNCIEVHRGSPGGANERNHYYQLGNLNARTGVITWTNGARYDTGGDLDIALDSSGRCVEVHRGFPDGSNHVNHYFRIGAVHFDHGTVAWGVSTFFETGGSLSVALDENGVGLNLHRGREGGSNENRRYYALICLP